MKKCTNWNRIIAVGGLTLCTTLVATGFNSYQSVINAVLVGGIALFTEMKFESEPLAKLQRKVSVALII
jgi:hypothetical protein